jgi:hypothetical protein
MKKTRQKKSLGRPVRAKDRIKDRVKAGALLGPAEACIDVVSEIVGV